VFLPEEEPQRSQVARSLAEFLVARVHDDEDASGRGGMLITTINGVAVAEHWMARSLLDAGFAPGAMGFNVRRNLPPLPGQRSGVSANA
jgi:ATP-dependent Lhr-like helicase